MRISNKIFSVKNKGYQKVFTVFGIKLSFRNNGAAVEDLLIGSGEIKQNIEQLTQKLNFIVERQEAQMAATQYLQARADDIFYNQQVLAQVPVMHGFFKQFKNCNKGKEVALIASGPTLNLYKKQENIIYCGVNGSIRTADYLDYLFCIDDYLHDEPLNKEIVSYKGNNCKKFFGILPQRRLRVLNQYTHFTERIRPEVINDANAYYFIHEDIWQNKWAVDLETEAFGDFGGSVFSALQFLLYTNPDKIYLIGNDCSQGQCFDLERETNHSGKIGGYKIFKEFKDKVYPNIEIISVNPVGLKGIFKDVYTKEFMEYKGDIQ